MKRAMLYFGSFNPMHRGHTTLAEYVLEEGLCDFAALVVSPQNPMKESIGLLPELTRFEMAEIACRETKYPDRIKPSAVEFVLPRPSYTIDTLRFLQENNGSDTEFSILMGADNIARINQWKEYDKILADYDIYVYPRTGYAYTPIGGRVKPLTGAPTFDCSSTDIRRALAEGRDTSSVLAAGVAEYIAKNRLYGMQTTAGSETERLKSEGREHYRRNEWGKALNAFRKVLTINADDTESREYVSMIEDILEFRYKDIYNP